MNSEQTDKAIDIIAQTLDKTGQVSERAFELLVQHTQVEAGLALVQAAVCALVAAFCAWCLPKVVRKVNETCEDTHAALVLALFLALLFFGTAALGKLGDAAPLLAPEAYAARALVDAALQ